MTQYSYERFIRTGTNIILLNKTNIKIYHTNIINKINIESYFIVALAPQQVQISNKCGKEGE